MIDLSVVISLIQTYLEFILGFTFSILLHKKNLISLIHFLARQPYDGIFPHYGSILSGYLFFSIGLKDVIDRT